MCRRQELPRYPCKGPAYVLPNMDNGGYTYRSETNANLGQIKQMISPAQNQYNSFFVQLQRRMTGGLSLQASYTFAKSIMLDGDNNQFDFSNTHCFAPRPAAPYRGRCLRARLDALIGPGCIPCFPAGSLALSWSSPPGDRMRDC